MEAVKEKQSYVFDRKLSDEEIHELVENYEYDLRYLDPDYDDGRPDEPIWDKYGNPTESTIRAMYEDRHDIGETMTLEEFFAELDEIRDEVDNAGDKTA